MTGYGRGSAATEKWELVVEVSSVNRKNLEAQVSTPKEWIGLDRILNDKIREQASRGKVYLQLKIQEFGEGASLQWDESLIREGLKRLRTLAESEGVPFEVNAELLLQLATGLQSNGQIPDWVELEEEILAANQLALDEWVTMRATEGEALKVDLDQRLTELRADVDRIEGFSGNTVKEYREKLMDRLRSADLELDPEDDRVLKEIALFADRCDISEEITRLNSHLDQLSAAMAEQGSVGRKMDFILQEVYRELNTIGSKSNNIDISRLVIDCKNNWERLREQAANVE